MGGNHHWYQDKPEMFDGLNKKVERFTKIAENNREYRKCHDAYSMSFLMLKTHTQTQHTSPIDNTEIFIRQIYLSSGKE